MRNQINQSNKSSHIDGPKAPQCDISTFCLFFGPFIEQTVIHNYEQWQKCDFS